jgi:putative endopeptidase
LPADKNKQKAAYRDFFTSYAVSWRNKDRAKKAKQSLLLDLHAPAPLRVNLIVRQFEEFYIAFDIKPTDTGYVSPELRIMLW